MATTIITSPDLFNLDSLNTELRLPSGTTAQRPSSPSAGEWRFNTSTNLIEMFDGSNWYSIQDEQIPPIPSENFNIVLYTGNGSTQSITGVGFQPDYVWIKERSQAESHRWFDSTRGATQRLFSNSTSAQSTASDSLTSFDSDGFSLGVSAGVNENSQSYVAWCWKANGGTTSSNTDGTITSTAQVNKRGGFSILTWTGTGAQGTIGHGLEDTPDVIISKRTDSTNNWSVYHKDLGLSHTSYPNWIYLNLDAAEQNSGTAANHPYYQAPSSTVIYQNTGTSENTNVNAGQYISYCFAEKTGYSSFGSYTGNGSDNGPIVNTGFEVRWIMLKNTTGTHSWLIYDASRPGTSVTGDLLYADTDQAENPLPPRVSFLTNGFQIVTSNTSHNASGQTYIYMAFASDPSTAPVLADSFSTSTWLGNSGNQSLTGYGFRPNFVWIKNLDQGDAHMLFDSVRMVENYINSNLTSAQASSATSLLSFDSDGFTLGGDGRTNTGTINYSGWAWKANSIATINTDGSVQAIVNANTNTGFSIGRHTAPSSEQNYTIGHGLSQKPDMVLFKRIDAVGGWYTWHKDLSQDDYYLYLHDNFDEAQLTQDTRVWGQQAFTSTTISARSNYTVDVNSDVIAYCFHAVSGFSDFGVYQGNGVSVGPTITIGFQPDFVLIKNRTNTADWVLYDSVRGGTLKVSPNTSTAEATVNGVNFLATGFSINGTDGALNGGASDFYIYAAFKIN